MDPGLVVPEVSAAFGCWIFFSLEKNTPHRPHLFRPLVRWWCLKLCSQWRFWDQFQNPSRQKKMATCLTTCLMKNVQFTVRSLRCAVVGAGVTSSKSWTLSARHSWHMKGDAVIHEFWKNWKSLGVKHVVGSLSENAFFGSQNTCCHWDMRRVCTCNSTIWGANFWKWIHSCNLGGFVCYAESQLQSVAWRSLKIFVDSDVHCRDCFQSSWALQNCPEHLTSIKPGVRSYRVKAARQQGDMPIHKFCHAWCHRMWWPGNKG